MKCENRTLTETQWNRVISLSKEYLDEIGFKAGKYEVAYDVDKVTISRIKIVNWGGINERNRHKENNTG